MGKGGERINSEEKLEVLINGRYYDVANLKHPGGSVLKYYAGKEIDASQAFHNFHNRSKKAQKMMESLPSRAADPKKLAELALPGQRELLEDFNELQREFEREGLFKPDLTYVTLKCAEFAAIFFFGAYLVLQDYFWVGTSMMALAIGRTGWLMHEAGHYSLTGHIPTDRFLQLIFLGFFLGMSPSWWRNQHNKHHAAPQKMGHDVDLNTLPLVAFTRKSALKVGVTQKQWLRWQAWLFPTIICYFVTTGWQYILHPRYKWKTKKYDEIAANVLRHLAWNLVFTWRFGVWKSFAIYFWMNWIQSNYSFISFAVSHSHLDTIDANDTTIDWVRYSSVYTMNVSPGPFKFISWWMSYLNFQIEHHLFPAMPQHRLPVIAPRVKAFLAKHNLPYQEKDYLTALYVTFQNLDKVGEDVFLG